MQTAKRIHGSRPATKRPEATQKSAATPSWTTSASTPASSPSRKMPSCSGPTCTLGSANTPCQSETSFCEVCTKNARSPVSAGCTSSATAAAKPKKTALFTFIESASTTPLLSPSPSPARCWQNGSALKTTVQELPDNRVRLEVEVPTDHLKHAVEHATSDLAASTKIPGFRKGKVPQKVLEARVGRDRIFSEAVESHIGGWFWNAAEDANLRPVSRPELN